MEGGQVLDGNNLQTYKLGASLYPGSVSRCCMGRG